MPRAARAAHRKAFARSLLREGAAAATTRSRAGPARLLLGPASPPAREEEGGGQEEGAGGEGKDQKERGRGMHRESRGGAGAEIGRRGGKVSFDLPGPGTCPSHEWGPGTAACVSKSRRGLVYGPRDINPRPVPSPAPPPPARRRDSAQVSRRQEGARAMCQLHHPGSDVQFEITGPWSPSQPGAQGQNPPPSACPSRTGKVQKHLTGSRPFWGEENSNALL